MTVSAFDYGLKPEKVYRIPSSAVSYHPDLANRRVFWSGEFRMLPACGGRMDRFTFANGDGEVWLRPFSVVEDHPNWN